MERQTTPSPHQYDDDSVQMDGGGTEGEQEGHCGEQEADGGNGAGDPREWCAQAACSVAAEGQNDGGGSSSAPAHQPPQPAGAGRKRKAPSTAE